MSSLSSPGPPNGAAPVPEPVPEGFGHVLPDPHSPVSLQVGVLDHAGTSWVLVQLYTQVGVTVVHMDHAAADAMAKALQAAARQARSGLVLPPGPITGP